MDLSPGGLPSVRPPGSAAERAALAFTESGLREAGLIARHLSTPAPMSPVLVWVLGALLRLSVVAFVWLGSVGMAAAAAIASVLLSVPGPPVLRSRLLAKIPGLRDTVHGVFVAVTGSEATRTAPLVVVARADSHPGAPHPLHPSHSWLAWASALVSLALVPASRLWPGSPWHWVWLAVSVEAALTVAGCLSREFARGPGTGTTGLRALVRAGELLGQPGVVRDVWLVAAGGGTVGAAALARFLDVESEPAQNAWVIVLDDGPSADIAIIPERSLLPPTTTRQIAVRAVAQAAITSGDAVDVGTEGFGSLEARVALRRGLPAITLVGTHGRRTAEIVDVLARTLL